MAIRIELPKNRSNTDQIYNVLLFYTVRYQNDKKKCFKATEKKTPKLGKQFLVSLDLIKIKYFLPR